MMTSLSTDQCSRTSLHWPAEEDCRVTLRTSNSQQLLQTLGLKVLCEDKTVSPVSCFIPCDEPPGPSYGRRIEPLKAYPVRMTVVAPASPSALSHLGQRPAAGAFGNRVRRRKRGAILARRVCSGSRSWRVATAGSMGLVFYSFRWIFFQ